MKKPHLNTKESGSTEDTQSNVNTPPPLHPKSDVFAGGSDSINCLKKLARQIHKIAEMRPSGTSPCGWIELCLRVANTGPGPRRLYKKDLPLSWKARQIVWTHDTSVHGVISFEPGERTHRNGRFHTSRTEVSVGRLVRVALELVHEAGYDVTEIVAKCLEASKKGGLSETQVLRVLLGEYQQKRGAKEVHESESLEKARSGEDKGPEAGESTRPENPEDDPSSHGLSEAASSRRDCSFLRCSASNGCDTGDPECPQNRRSGRSRREKSGGCIPSLPPSSRARHKPNRTKFESRGTLSQRQFLDAKARMPAERLLFLHLLGRSRRVSYSASGQPNEWTTVPGKVLEEEMGAPYHATHKVWKDSELVECRDDGEYVSPQQAEEKGIAPKARVPNS